MHLNLGWADEEGEQARQQLQPPAGALALQPTVALPKGQETARGFAASQRPSTSASGPKPAAQRTRSMRVASAGAHQSSGGSQGLGGGAVHRSEPLHMASATGSRPATAHGLYIGSINGIWNSGAATQTFTIEAANAVKPPIASKTRPPSGRTGDSSSGLPGYYGVKPQEIFRSQAFVYPASRVPPPYKEGRAGIKEVPLLLPVGPLGKAAVRPPTAKNK